MQEGNQHGSQSVGLHTAGLQALGLPSFKTPRKSPESVTKTSSGLMDGGAYMSEAVS